tara:strand:+ start:111 stop:737 length:627 start_codon:yes stop_codon:yes gene_type:complete
MRRVACSMNLEYIVNYAKAKALGIMKYKIHENFLPPDLFEKIKNLVMDQDFPWRRRDKLDWSEERFAQDHTVSNPELSTYNNIYFTYNFFNDMKSSSDFYEPYIIPILEKLKAGAPIQVRANMFISNLFKTSGWHTDYFSEVHGGKETTAILFLNDCDGGTEIKVDNKDIFIKAEANKIVVLDSDVLHRARTSKKEPIRYIVNFNYFK